MRSALYWIVLVAVGCSGSPKQNALPVQEPAPLAERAQPDVPVPPAQPPKLVDATPEKAKGDPREAEFAKLIAGYFDAFINVSPQVTADRKKVVFVSNRDGLPQLYVGDVAKPADKPMRLTTTTERVGNPLLTKDRKAVLFLSDSGADENWSIYRVGLDGKEIVNLTPGDKLNRDEPFLVDSKPDLMLFSARKMSESRSTLYSASTVKPGEAKPIYTDELPGFLTDVDAKGTTALFVQYPQRMENYLLRVDVASGKAEKLWPTDAKVTIFEARLSADGKHAYVSTDLGGEENVLLALDVKTGKELARYATTPKSAQINGVSVAKKGGLIALSILNGDHSELLFLDSKLKPTKTKVKLPLAQGGFGDFSDDGKRITLVYSTTDKPQDSYIVDAAKGTIAPLRKDTRDTLASLPKIKTTIVDIPSFDGGKIPTLVYVKEGEENQPHPTIVSYHGGPSGVSMVRWSSSIAFWLTLGYAYVEPNVRGSSGYGRAYEAGDNGKKRLDAFRDIEASARWVSQQPWADKSKLVVYGGSYGGYTTLVALSRWPDIWRAGVNLFGVVNLKTFMASTSGLIRQIFLTEFGDPDKDAEFLAQISPLTDVGKIVDPTFVYAGANDPRVPRTESDLIVKALREKGVPSEYMVADNEGHSLSRKENLVEFHARCARFLETHLK
jgi:prolyl oligopeptidase PreP (S9A serine peptidase family)